MSPNWHWSSRDQQVFILVNVDLTFSTLWSVATPRHRQPETVRGWGRMWRGCDIWKKEFCAGLSVAANESVYALGKRGVEEGAGRRKQNEAGVGELWLRLTASVDPMRSSEARITIRGLLLRVEFDQRSNCQHPLDHQSKRVPEKHLFPLYWQRQSLWLCGSQKTVENSSRDGNTRPPDLPPEKSVCRSGRNS